MKETQEKQILLPPRHNGERLTLKGRPRRLVVIGANGAGKSRFTDALADSPTLRPWKLSSLTGIYGTGGDSGVSALFDSLYPSETLRPAAANDMEKLVSLLMHDEMVGLLGYKMERTSNPAAELPETMLDRLMKVWRETFPENNILIENGKFLFSRGVASRGYSALRLSAGEKAALYYISGVLYAPGSSTVFVESPELFMHPSVMGALWNRIENLRPDCSFVYTTHDLEFASSRQGAKVIWVRDYDAASVSWDYDILPPQHGISDEVYMAIIGARKPVLFIEGDGVHSIDARLYPLVFTDYTVKSLGSCNKVIEATRSFNDLAGFHHLDSRGIVDRDRRDEQEVAYLRGRRIMVPDVAEIENILMLEEVVRAVASSRGKDEHRVFAKVKASIMGQFRHDLRQQALMHTRHRVKRTVEYRIDGRFDNINLLERHIASLVDEINPRGLYESFCRKFRSYLDNDDYNGVLKVYNQKSMIPGSNVPALCGLNNKEEYTAAIISLLRSGTPQGERIRRAVRHCFRLDGNDNNEETTKLD